MNDLRFWSGAEYKGEYFESQTEAAWAAYFDAVDIPYIREPETFLFQFSQGYKRDILYTPDFYLPEQDSYGEVKNGNITPLAVEKMHYLARCTGRAVLMLGGKPHYGVAKVYGPDHKLFPDGKVYDMADYSCWISDLWKGKPDNDETAQIIKRAIEQSKKGWSLTNNESDVAIKALKRREELWQNPAVIKVD